MTFQGLYATGTEDDLAGELRRLLNRQAPVSEAEIRGLTNQLRIHQIELELQNRELQEVQQQLERSRDYYSDLYDFAPVGYCTLDGHGRVIKINLRGATLVGVDRVKLIDQCLFNRLPHGARRRFLSLIDQVLRTGSRQSLELELPELRGGTFLRLELERTRAPEGQNYCLAALIDITESKSTENRLRLTASVFDKTLNGVMITDATRRIMAVNPAFTSTTGYSAEEVVGQPASLLKSGRHGPDFYQAMQQQLDDTGYWAGQIWNRRKNGELYCESLSICTVLNPQGEIRNYIGMFVDITTQLKHQQRLEYIAHFDPLTGLANRTLLADRMNQDMAHTRRRGKLLAVAFLDLDGFKSINDQHGHAVGDQLLQTLTARMAGVMRVGDTLARMGGDEFIIILPDLSDSNDCVFSLNRLLEVAIMPVPANGQELQVSASIGVTFYPQSEEVDGDQLIRQADQAMYQAKLAGKNRFWFFDQSLEKHIRGYNELIQEIERGLARNEFELYYQPKVNMRSGAVLGVEALIRWQHPSKGLLSPAAFLPIIEDHPLAIHVGDWVLETVLRQLEAWREAGLYLSVSINIGARQLQQTDFMDKLRHQLAAHPRIMPRHLELEVLETSALMDIRRVSGIMRDCLDLGIKTALDDFGTGYSSLTYLKLLPAYYLKIDQSFVRDILEDPSDLAIIEGILGMAQSFEREPIAEGIETVDQGEILLDFGCDCGQGYAIARPMPAAEVMDWVRSWQPDPRWHNKALLGRDSLPFLVAGIELRSWHQSIVNYLHDGTQERPQLDHDQCRFGKWLQREENQRYRHLGAYQDLDALHRQIHQLAMSLCTDRDATDRQAFDSEFHRLEQLEADLLEKLGQGIHAVG
jgi:diguanylate cyclase (GGDEF)-like protein/PAS domain S-box-containing protein